MFQRVETVQTFSTLSPLRGNKRPSITSINFILFPMGWGSELVYLCLVANVQSLGLLRFLGRDRGIKPKIVPESMIDKKVVKTDQNEKNED